MKPTPIPTDKMQKHEQWEKLAKARRRNITDDIFKEMVEITQAAFRPGRWK